MDETLVLLVADAQPCSCHHLADDAGRERDDHTDGEDRPVGLRDQADATDEDASEGQENCRPSGRRRTVHGPHPTGHARVTARGLHGRVVTFVKRLPQVGAVSSFGFNCYRPRRTRGVVTTAHGGPRPGSNHRQDAETKRQ